MGKKAQNFKKWFVDIFSGDIIIKREMYRQMWFVAYIFALFCIIIAWSLYVEKKMVQVERNAKTIEALEVSYHQRSIELVGLDQRTKVEALLEKNHSRLLPPVEPAKRIKGE
ncbi:MAG: hypothetical protein IKX03_02860 [Bacteroidales bacterium]|nr:hypothetical protein [Bacteroidales bacterium]MBR5056117.1 hypothetical protein [Bacteroidales bacterium]